MMWYVMIWYDIWYMTIIYDMFQYDEFQSYPYDLATSYPHIAAISYGRHNDSSVIMQWCGNALYITGPLPVTGGYPSQRVSNVDLWCFRCCQPAQAQLNLVMRSPIWPRGGSAVFSPQFALIMASWPYETTSLYFGINSWWRHQIETFSALLAFCAGNSPVTGEFPHKGQWRGALMFSLICAWINDCVNNREAGNLRRNRVHYDVIVILVLLCCYMASCPCNGDPATSKLFVNVQMSFERHR